MGTLASMLGDLRDMLRDTNPAAQKWSDQQLTTYVNRAIGQLYPEVFARGENTSQVTSASTLRHPLPVDCPVDGLVDPPVRQVLVGPAPGSSSALFAAGSGFDALQEELVRGWWVDLGTRELVLPYRLAANRPLRMTYMRPIRSLANATDVFEGSDSAYAAVLKLAESEAYAQRERSSLSDTTKLGNLLKLRAVEKGDWREMIVGPGGCAMQPIALVQ